MNIPCLLFSVPAPLIWLLGNNIRVQKWDMSTPVTLHGKNLIIVYTLNISAKISWLGNF